MALPDIMNIIAQHLASQGHGTLGTDIFEGPVRGADLDGAGLIPVNAIFVQAQAGNPPERVSSNMAAVRYNGAQIRVRNAVHDVGDVIARAVHDTVAGTLPAALSDLWPEQSYPVYVGQDEEDYYHWSINVIAVTI